MYRMDLNNWHTKPKNSTIYTPQEVSGFLFQLLKDKFPPKSLIFDPGCGGYSLLTPWQQANYQTLGLDNDLTSQADFHRDFLLLPKWNYYRLPTLILCNPPFNGSKPKLAPEIWLDQIISLFGKAVPIVLFAPIGLRLNSTLKSKRHLKFVNRFYPPITSQITLTRDVYNLEPSNRKTEFHSEILIFNIPNLLPHYFFHPAKIEQRTPG